MPTFIVILLSVLVVALFGAVVWVYRSEEQKQRQSQEEFEREFGVRPDDALKVQ